MGTRNDSTMKDLALRLYEINAFKFGDFKMKVGINSPVYFDLRVIVSYPKVLKTVCDLLMAHIEKEKFKAKHVCGVPYTALPLATIVSIYQDIPMLVRRKEAKAYGTKKLIEGIYQAGDTCLIIEDVVTSGSSILDTVRDLQSEGIVVTDALVVVDREQGGVGNLAEHSVRMHSLFTLSFLMEALLEAGKIQRQTVDAVAKFIAGCQINIDGSLKQAKAPIVKELKRSQMPFEQRAKLARCELAQRLFNLMATKKTNLCLAVDKTDYHEILRIVDICGPYICVLKTHVDIVENFDSLFVTVLQGKAKQHNFLIMEDRKFADIGNTVSLQYSRGTYQIRDWADLVTAHSLSGHSVLQGLIASIRAEGPDGLNVTKSRAVFLLAEMSTRGNLIDARYREATVKLATEGEDSHFVAGIVCQSEECFSFPGLVQLTPGVQIAEGGDSLGQQYNTPEYVMKQKGADVAVVGRGILNAKCIEEAAKMYRDRLWAAYMERIGQ